MAAHAPRYQRSHVLVTAAASAAVCVGLPIASLLIGKNFSEALHLIPVLCAILVFESISFANADLVFYLNKTGALPKITLTAGLLNVAFNVVLIPFFSIWGAILARALSMAFRGGVMWYAARPHVGLWVFLIALPFVVLVTGCATLLRSWNDDVQLRQAAAQAFTALRAHLAMVFVAAATLTAGGVLAIVTLHVLTD